MYIWTLRAPLTESRARIALTHLPIVLGEVWTLVRVAGPGGIGLPSLPTPSPASPRVGSTRRCVGKTDKGKDGLSKSLATHPMIGRVNAVWRRCETSSS